MAGVSSHYEIEASTELRLGLPGIDVPDQPPRRGSKRALAESDEECSETGSAKSSVVASPAAKAPVVGWPPIRSYRRSSIRARKTEAVGIYVKVSMDGAPYLRKIDLKVYNGYEELRKALEGMFKCFSLGELSGADRCECAITYEDKDGDLMLVGDVPWEMFISSCKRLRIMRGSEARGLGSTL